MTSSKATAFEPESRLGSIQIVQPSKATFRNRNKKRLSLKAMAIAGQDSESSCKSDAKNGSIQPIPSATSAAASIFRLSSEDIIQDFEALKIGLEFQIDFCDEDLRTVTELGHGNGGVVCKTLHLPTRTIMAKKSIHIEGRPEVRKQILRELQILHDCSSPYIISFYGAFVQDSDICICMEFMDRGSLDRILKNYGPIPPDIVGKITVAVVEGLDYLYTVHHIIHRDVKPSNILLNSKGQIKLCDFGVSGELINSVADTFVGTSFYMSPERIKGAAYSVKSDVWSVGICLFELIVGHSPYQEEQSKKMSILELLQRIVMDDPPKLPTDFDLNLQSFIAKCLMKEGSDRPDLKTLKQEPYFLESLQSETDVSEWAKSIKS